MQEHLREVRGLRQRLEDSIQTNDRLRQKLEDRLAHTPSETGTRVQASGSIKIIIIKMMSLSDAGVVLTRLSS